MNLCQVSKWLEAHGLKQLVTPFLKAEVLLLYSCFTAPSLLLKVRRSSALSACNFMLLCWIAKFESFDTRHCVSASVSASVSACLSSSLCLMSCLDALLPTLRGRHSNVMVRGVLPSSSSMEPASIRRFKRREDELAVATASASSAARVAAAAPFYCVDASGPSASAAAAVAAAERAAELRVTAAQLVVVRRERLRVQRDAEMAVYEKELAAAGLAAVSLT